MAATPSSPNAAAPSPRITPAHELPRDIFFDPQADVFATHSGNLPHWRQRGVCYFVTWRTEDSMPHDRVQQWQRERNEWLERNREPHSADQVREYHRLFSERWEAWLDESHGACELADSKAREIVEETLRNRAGQDYDLDAYAVAPNHVHCLVTPREGQQLSDIMQAWKSVSAHRLNKLLGRSGTFWQKEYFDHIVRSPEQMEKLRDYAAGHLRGGALRGEGAAAPGGGAPPPLLRDEVTDEEIAKVVAAWTGIPVSNLREGEREKLIKMEQRLGARVIGQKQAIIAVSNAVRRARSGLQDPNRPIGSFIFLGPTGVGKTELARALAEFLFDDENAMARIDMSEYMEKHSVARLIGAPPGYVGFEEGGQLTETVRRKPYSVVLFDEIEKAHHDVFNVLLQVLDDGRITDGQGRTVDFKNSVIIMTSNIGSQFILDDANAEQREARVMEALRGHFRPEFLNRVDETIIFDRLSDKDLEQIVGIQLKRLEKRLADQKLTLVVTDEAKRILAAEGYDPVYGARPLKRAIQRELLDPLSMEILAGNFREGETVTADAKGGKITFAK